MKRIFDPKKIKAIAIDLDGTTLKPQAILGDRTKECLRKLMFKGIRVIITTGRAIESAEPYRRAIGTEGPMVFFNGAEVADVSSGEILHTNMISREVAEYCVDIARGLGVHFQLYLPPGISPVTGDKDPACKWEALVIDKYGDEAEFYFKHTGLKATVADLKTITTNPKIKGFIKGMYIADPSLHEKIKKGVADRYGDLITVMRSHQTFLEVINKGVSKGEGLKIVMQYYDLKPEEVIAFGDEDTDVTMFPVAGFCAAPANAREQIREAADEVYGSYEDEGLAIWLEKTFDLFFSLNMLFY